VPVVILLTAFYFKYSTPDKMVQNSSLTPIISPAKLSTSKLNNEDKVIKIDLKGSYKCEYNDNNKSVNAYIKNKHIYVEFTTNKITDIALVSGDCGYKWQKGTFKGNKMCGVSQVMNMYESVSSLPFIGSEVLFSMLGSVNSSVTLSQEELKDIAKTCKSQTVSDTIFVIPANISFQDKGQFTFTPQE
jgi:hypothetical protein